ncbi:hypothetical protein [Photobacterium kishitanii]|uniref:Uncharacterized protein n=1 Tax=Photobacterium kishitanii TaxID=318456 RepID=A0A2T3KMR8_9GAMM|nr:hypothetical protein [Photobacterium kishitanii]PSV01074.1 hypothetical protein C9J27_03385 [Photobacterium kishitanii]
MKKKKILKIIAIDTAVVLSSLLAATSASAMDEYSQSSSHAGVASSDPYACTDAEVNKLIGDYKQAQDKSIAATALPSFASFRQERMIMNRGDDKNLCDILSDPSFKNPLPSWDDINKAWATLKTLYQAKAGLDYGSIIRVAAEKLYDKGVDKLKKGVCKMTKKASSSIHNGIDSAWNDAKRKSEKAMVSTDQAQKLGVKSLGDNTWKEVAGSKTKKELGEYDRYGHWYEDGFTKDNALQSNIDSLITNELDHRKEKAINDNVKRPDKTPLDKFKNIVSPNY